MQYVSDVDDHVLIEFLNDRFEADSWHTPPYIRI